MRAFVLPVLVLSIQLCEATALASEMFDVEAAVRHAVAHNPDIMTAQAEVTAAEARQRQSALLFQTNPNVDAAAGPRNADRKSGDYSVELSQQVEVGGQRPARADAAKANLEARRARVAWRRVEIAASVRESFGRVLAAQRLFEVARESEGTAQQAMQAAEKRFHAGDIARIEVNAARVERGRSVQERSRAEQRAAVALAELRLLLALAPDDALVLRGELPNPSAEPSPDLPTLIRKALGTRADLQAAGVELEGARAESKLASREWLPSPRIGASFAHEQGADIIQGRLGFTLPTFQRNQAGRGAAAARVVQAEQSLQALRRSAEQEIHLAHLRLQVAEEAASAYAGEVVTAMQENLDLSNRAYQASQIDFTQLLLIRRASLEAQRGYVEALEELNAARAQLKRAVGTE